MKKILSFIACFLLCLKSHGQSISFNNLLHILSEKDVEAYITSKPFSFVKNDGPFPEDRYFKNANTPNVEMIGYEKTHHSVKYTTANKAFMIAVIKQIKYPLILKSDDPNSSLYYQFGDTHMMITIDIYKKKSEASLTMYRK